MQVLVGKCVKSLTDKVHEASLDAELVAFHNQKLNGIEDGENP